MSLSKIQHRTKTGQLVSLSFSSGDRRDGGRRQAEKNEREDTKVKLLLKTKVTDVQMRIWPQYSNCSYKQDHLLSYMEIQTIFFTSTHPDFSFFPSLESKTKPAEINYLSNRTINIRVWYINIRKVFSNSQHEKFLMISYLSSYHTRISYHRFLSVPQQKSINCCSLDLQ